MRRRDGGDKYRSVIRKISQGRGIESGVRNRGQGFGIEISSEE
jgi:hypothetical protein